MKLSKEILLDMLEKMLLARAFDTPLDNLVFESKIPATVHQCIGQEGNIGTIFPLNKDDYIFTGHRSHGLLLAKGLDPKKMMAEIFGKSTGYNKGKGGSMHITAPEYGALGSNGILGYVTVLVNGPAFYSKLKKLKKVSVAYFGEGASNQGFVHEGMNLAAIWKLPTIFVLENNHYAEATAVEYACSTQDLTLRGKAYGIPSYNVDGSDILEVYNKMQEIVSNARNNKGPSLLVIDCYRYKGHQIGEPGGYRLEEEIQNYKNTKDPIIKFKKHLISLGYLDENKYLELEKRAKKIIDDAIKFADESPYPDPSETYTEVYV
ncbi:MAG: thiamine pyrophosphate-dependent dehydrogenase E1 component subunit alpha [Actinomycetota bacterium]|nr:thiamine pyrophosphate-dependent dehydrogenase E1 component subunit alpha [Actinomycetota bacterium]